MHLRRMRVQRVAESACLPILVLLLSNAVAANPRLSVAKTSSSKAAVTDPFKLPAGVPPLVVRKNGLLNLTVPPVFGSFCLTDPAVNRACKCGAAQETLTLGCCKETQLKFSTLKCPSGNAKACLDLTKYKTVYDLTCHFKYPGAYYHGLLDCLVPATGLLARINFMEDFSRGDAIVLIPEKLWNRDYTKLLLPPSLQESAAVVLKKNSRPAHVQLSPNATVLYSKPDFLCLPNQEVCKNPPSLLQYGRQCGHWMHNLVVRRCAAAIEAARDKWGPQPLEGGAEAKPSNILFIQRTASRKFLNLEDMMEATKAAFPDATVKDAMLEKLPFDQQVSALYTADIIVHFHGAAAASALFARPHALIIEITPGNKTANTYWKSNNKKVTVYHGKLHFVTLIVPYDSMEGWDQPPKGRARDWSNHIKELSCRVREPHIKQLIEIIDKFRNTPEILRMLPMSDEDNARGVFVWGTTKK